MSRTQPRPLLPNENFGKVFRRLLPSRRRGAPNDGRTLCEAIDFEVGKIYNRRKDIYGRFGGQGQGGISTPKKAP